MGTDQGLNVFDGYNITVFTREQYPQLPNDVVTHLFTDSDNRVWIGTFSGASWINDKRVMNRVKLQDSISAYYCHSIFETGSYGVVIHTNKGQFYFDQVKQSWQPVSWLPADLNKLEFLDISSFDKDKIILCLGNKVRVVDYKSRSIVYEGVFEIPVTACRIKGDKIAIGLQKGIVKIVDISSRTTISTYQLFNEANGKKIPTTLSEVRLASDGSLLIATATAGIAVIDSLGNIHQYRHNPIDPTSISTNNTYRIIGGPCGEVIVGTPTSGANVCNINCKQAGYKKIFSDAHGDLYDGYINDIAEDKKGDLWICAYDRMIQWKKAKNESRFYQYHQKESFGINSLEFNAVCIDKKGRIWAGVGSDGLAVFDASQKKFRKVLLDTSLGLYRPYNFIRDLIVCSDGSIWGGSPAGLFSYQPSNSTSTNFNSHPLLKELKNQTVFCLLEDRNKNIWIGTTTRGIYRYNRSENTLLHFGSKEGLLANGVAAFLEDRQGNIYAATRYGFNVISPKDQVQSFGRANGLRYNYCNSFLEDEFGNIWIANNKCLVKFNPSTKSMQVFDKNSGISESGFRLRSCYKTANGELVWGSQDGINYFKPGELLNNVDLLYVNLNQVQLQDSSWWIGEDTELTIPYKKNNITFYFSAINLNGAGNIQYQYILEGLDKAWQSGFDVRQARYNSLPAGTYRFKVKASMDGIYWTQSDKNMTVEVIPPLWQRWWFIVLCVSLIVTSVYFTIHSLRKKEKRQREQIETERAINYFASSMYGYQTVESILWDVARNCIGRLNFEDCVIYLTDEKRNVLVQKAAFGPKSPRVYEIDKPIEIELGTGIVGSVAMRGHAEIVSDTTKDPRYIVDDQPRYSEITVPIISDNKVLGIIDCEHSKKSFFTQKHLSILTTIASLCANKIIRAKAEEEKAQAQAVLMDTQQKMTEVEMQALRAQMNPHFIFNCLNSINRYIVKSDQATASLYLTKFAKLIRLILDNSNSKNVVLSHEIEALKLYIDMEALRFDKKFSYTIDIDDNVNADSLEVPPLIIQPYVENAIWHGLLHKNNLGQLHIHLSLPTENILQCIIEDDGIGREKAKELKSKSATTKKSLGMKLTENRLSLLNKYSELNARIEIIDLYTQEREPAGTKVILTIPV